MLFPYAHARSDSTSVEINNYVAADTETKQQTRSDALNGERIIIDIVKKAQARGELDDSNRVRFGCGRRRCDDGDASLPRLCRNVRSSTRFPEQRQRNLAADPEREVDCRACIDAARRWTLTKARLSHERRAARGVLAVLRNESASGSLPFKWEHPITNTLYVRMFDPKDTPRIERSDIEHVSHLFQPAAHAVKGKIKWRYLSSEGFDALYRPTIRSCRN